MSRGKLEQNLFWIKFYHNSLQHLLVRLENKGYGIDFNTKGEIVLKKLKK